MWIIPDIKDWITIITIIISKNNEGMHGPAETDMAILPFCSLNAGCEYSVTNQSGKYMLQLMQIIIMFLNKSYNEVEFEHKITRSMHSSIPCLVVVLSMYVCDRAIEALSIEFMLALLIASGNPNCMSNLVQRGKLLRK